MNTHLTFGLPKKPSKTSGSFHHVVSKLVNTTTLKKMTIIITVTVFGLIANVSNIQLSRLKPFVIFKTKTLKTTTIPSRIQHITLFTITL